MKEDRRRADRVNLKEEESLSETASSWGSISFSVSLSLVSSGEVILLQEMVLFRCKY